MNKREKLFAELVRRATCAAVLVKVNDFMPGLPEPLRLIVAQRVLEQELGFQVQA